MEALKTISTDIIPKDVSFVEMRLKEYMDRALSAEDECRKLRKELLEKNYELTQELVKNRFKKIN